MAGVYSARVIVWRLRKGADRRFRAGHPWVYSNELQESPKGVAPGEVVELADAGGAFLARGHGNPSSLIAFRVLSRDPAELDPAGPVALAARLTRAGALRAQLGFSGVSARLCFGEADGLPGLIVDSYVLADGSHVLVLAAHSAGMDRALAEHLEALVAAACAARGADPGATAVVLRNDVQVRKLEGLEVPEPRVVRTPGGVELARASIRTAAGTLETDLAAGQKTGFFLDQAENLALAARHLGRLSPAPGAPLRILDLCCYVGQWSAGLARAFRAAGHPVAVTLVDSSARALEVAARNVEAAGATAEPIKGDVLRDLAAISGDAYDLVVADPPALIQRRKDVPQGSHAYLQLDTQAIRLVRPGGGVVACSCSALFEEEVFVQTLAKASRRAGKPVRWIARGGQAPDHPVLMEFPEGRYLKCWIGVAG
jgi:23S rRNA (cytosine1962-C5)-methyltransferase